MEVHLRPGQQEFVERQVRDGLFGDVGEVIKAAVAEMEAKRYQGRKSKSFDDLIEALRACPDPDFELEQPSFRAPVGLPVDFE